MIYSLKYLVEPKKYFKTGKPTNFNSKYTV